MNGPLSGLTVIDQTQALAGPYCSMMLGDLGAEVLSWSDPAWVIIPHVGPPFLGDQSSYYLAVNRNKRSMTLNFSKPEGQEVLHRLTDKADIFLTNLPRMASLQKYNMDYETLSARNPGDTLWLHHWLRPYRTPSWAGWI